MGSSNILQVTELEEGERDPSKEQKEESVISESRERELSQSEDSKEEETMRYISIHSIYDETNLLCSELCLLFVEVPSSYSLAAKQVWRSAMKEEISAILRNNTWTMVKPRKDIRPIGVKWVFRVKKDIMGKMVRYKARLVVKGHSIKEGIEYGEVFSPVARMESIRILIAITAQDELHHLDVKTAFLNEEIKEDIYISQPEGFKIKGKEDHILNLTKALYGLKQAPRAWNSKLNEVLIQKGFVRSKNDYVVYYEKVMQERVITGVYVDDMIITWPNSCKIKKFKESMKQVFEMTDLGIQSSYLGTEIKHKASHIWLFQKSYIETILHTFNMSKCNSARTPMEARLKFEKDRREESI